MIQPVFWTILGLGISIPATVVLVHNLSIKAREGEEYQLQLRNLAVVYAVDLLGIAILFGIGGK